MTLEQQESFLRSRDWGWYVDALAFNRDALTKDQRQDEHLAGIVQAKRDYYATAIGLLADRLAKKSK